MSLNPLTALSSALLLLLGGCAEFEAWNASFNAPAAAQAPSTASDSVYVTSAAPVDVAGYRNIYIAPANLANMQVILPEGAYADPEWWVTEEEGVLLRRTIAHEFTLALTYQLDFNIVSNLQEAQLVVNTAVVAVHPNETRSAIAKGAKPGGSITVSVAVVNAANDKVLVRAVDTRGSEDIWAFNEVTGEDPELNKVFASWGRDLRSGILQLQGRSDDTPVLPLASGN